MDGLTDLQEVALEIAREEGSVRSSDVSNLVPCDRSTAYRHIVALCDRGVLQAVGEKKGRVYVPVE